FVTDLTLDRVQRFTADGVLVGAWGTSGGAPGQLSSPTGVVVDTNGFVVVTDAGNSRVQAFRPDGSFVLAFGTAGSGQGQLLQAPALDVDPLGRLVVLDKDNSRVQVFANLATPARRKSWGSLKDRFR